MTRIVCNPDPWSPPPRPFSIPYSLLPICYSLSGGSTVLILAAAVVLLQAQAPQPKAENPAEMAPQTSWVGGVQAGSAPATFRLNLDPGTAVAGPGDPVSLGSPFIQLLAAPKLNLAKHAGDHVTIKGKELTPEEAEHEAALHPDQQEANATAGGTGGRSERHLRYLRVQSIALSPGNCRLRAWSRTAARR